MDHRLQERHNQQQSAGEQLLEFGGQISELVLLILCLARPLFRYAREPIRQWLKDGDSFFVEGIKRDSPPGLRRTFELLPDAAALEFGAGLVLVGLQHAVGALVLLPQVMHGPAAADWTVPSVRHVALADVAFAIVHIVDLAYMHLSADTHKQKRPAARLIFFVAGLNSLSIILCIPMNMYYQMEHVYALMVFCFKLSGLGFMLLAPVTCSLSHEGLTNLPVLWMLGALDVLISLTFRTLLLPFCCFRVVKILVHEGAWFMILFGCVPALCTLAANLVLISQTCISAWFWWGTAQIKED